jgi:glycosyltransferase involved in cell wall biosynthesis
MPAWQSEAFIDKTLRSLAQQTYPNLQILISDDASTDRTGEICQQFAISHPNCTYERQPHRLGWIGNVNTLLRKAQGKYLFFAFHDDPLEPDYVASMVEALEHNPQAILAFTDICVGDNIASYRELEGIGDRFSRAKKIIHKRGYWWIPNRGLFRAEAIELTRGMRRHLGGEYSADWPWLLHLALLGEFIRIPRPLVHKVFRSQGLSTVWQRDLSRWKSAAVALACGNEILRATIPWSQKPRLLLELLVYFAGKLIGLPATK